MKSFLLILLSLVVFGCTNSPSNKVKKENVEEASQRKDSKSDLPELSFKTKEYDFGTINEGDIVETTFDFENTGNSNLLIIDAKGSCGCTVPDYPKNIPIAPGEKASIKVKFDSSNKPGNQMKTVTLTTNTERGRDLLRIRTKVTPDPVKEKQRNASRNLTN
jgi:hypothetical protein